MAGTRSFKLLLLAALASSSVARLTPKARSAADSAPPVIASSAPVKTRSHVTRHLRVDDGTVDPKIFPRANVPEPDLGGIQKFNKTKGPQRGKNGAPFYHPSNYEIDAQNPDNVAPPPTDTGVVPNLVWSFSHSHTRLLNGGWVREQVVTDLPISKDIAAAELTLAPYAYRELHWHRVAEWAYVLSGSGRLAVLDAYGKSYTSDIETGDIWYFPIGSGHSFQALDKGLEILVAFADGNFDATGTTFLLADWIAHTPKEILAKNFGVPVSTFNNTPDKSPYIYKATVDPPSDVKQVTIPSPDGEVENPFVYKLSKAQPKQAKGGWLKIADSTNFPASTEIASAIVHIDVGGLRELHWHPLADEWIYIVSGKARITAFIGSANARTFDLRVGDTAVLPTNAGHYVENIGDEPLVFLELYKAERVTDISLAQWLALTPHQATVDGLKVSKSFVDGISHERQLIVKADKS